MGRHRRPHQPPLISLLSLPLFSPFCPSSLSHSHRLADQRSRLTDEPNNDPPHSRDVPRSRFGVRGWQPDTKGCHRQVQGNCEGGGRPSGVRGSHANNRIPWHGAPVRVEGCNIEVKSKQGCVLAVGGGLFNTTCRFLSFTVACGLSGDAERGRCTVASTLGRVSTKTRKVDATSYLSLLSHLFLPPPFHTFTCWLVSGAGRCAATAGRGKGIYCAGKVPPITENPGTWDRHMWKGEGRR